ncbi:hypothetical protein FHX37_4393 [Haloactinospora alba]|uniref:Uncharacterized protein n=1 Tax=Haloactinospora alba TaxID=405555 RepID=A0A543N760_9ACTN|nr:hypothetical protein [Haloactinospora alba]TQN27668.1 hypothetical protein FHX37_4393 [Haloactinospora alba]
MPKHQHEFPLELFHYHPGLAPELLGHAFSLDLPSYDEARLASGELTDRQPTEYRADGVVALFEEHTAVSVIVVEVQLRRDEEKRSTWPVYTATLARRWKCPVALLVLCPDERTASWCAEPVDVGYGRHVLRPQVLGPRATPLVTEQEQADRNPELAVLSVLAHSGDSRVLRTFHDALRLVDDERAGLYVDYVASVLPDVARKELEELLVAGTEEYRSDFARKYFTQGEARGEARGEAKGEARGEARSVLAVLEARGIAVPEDVRSRITGCADTEQLNVWVRRAAVVDSAEELFD